MGKRKTYQDHALPQQPAASGSSTHANGHPATPVGSSLPDMVALDPPPSAKRQRKGKGKDIDAPATEKRGAMLKKKCPQNILERVERVMSQRFFMVDRKRISSELREEFSVLGSTGNVYTVIIDKKPSCNCPDAMKGNHCKHILFVYLKVLQLPQSSNLWYQKALLTSELETIFASAPQAPNALANSRVRDAFARATGKAVSSSNSESGAKKRLPGPGDDCPICYEDMHHADEKTLTFCETCGNALHTECFNQWARSSKTVTCVWCRAEWTGVTATASTAGSTHLSEGYVNLGSVAGLSPVRDTSSYYRRPYGYGWRSRR